MINILREGLKDKKTKTIYTALCNNCQCLFEFEHEDIKSQEKRIDGNIEIDCPCCNKTIKQPLSHFLSREVEDKSGKIKPYFEESLEEILKVKDRITINEEEKW